jgi:hypothetical protein
MGRTDVGIPISVESSSTPHVPGSHDSVTISDAIGTDRQTKLAFLKTILYVQFCNHHLKSMPLLSPRIRELLIHSVSTFIFAIVILIFAVLLSYAKDGLVVGGRPEWLIVGTECLSIILFVADGIVIVLVCAKIINEVFSDLFR